MTQTVTQDTSLEKQAKDHHISTGKAALIRQAMALNGSLTFEGLAQLSVEELRDLIEAGAPGMPIGMQAALEAAAQYAGLTTADNEENSLRPQHLEDYIGQDKVKQNLKIYLEAAKRRGEPVSWSIRWRRIPARCSASRPMCSPPLP